MQTQLSTRPEPSSTQKAFMSELRQAGYREVASRVDEIAAFSKSIDHKHGRYVLEVTLQDALEVGALIVRINVTGFYLDTNPTGSSKHSVMVHPDVAYLESVAKRCFESLIG